MTNNVALVYRTMVIVMAVAMVGCGSGRDVASHAEVPTGVPSSPEPVEGFERLGTPSRLVRSGGVLLIADDSFPADLWRFEDEPGRPRLVNPPMPLFQVGVVPSGDGFLVVGHDCTGAKDPQGSEPQCPGPVVALRYDPSADTWLLLSDQVVPSTRWMETFPGPDDSAIVTWLDGRGLSHLAEVGSGGEARKIAEPEQVESENWRAKVCATEDGLVALTSPTVDAPVAGSVASTWSFDSRNWSAPVPLPSDIPPATSSTATCTDTGVALLGTASAAGEGPMPMAPSASFDGTSWSISSAPSGLARLDIDLGPEGVVFGEELWRHDPDGRWVSTGLSVSNMVGATRVDDQTILVASGKEAGSVRIQTVHLPKSGRR